MDFVDWCDRVLRVLIEASRESAQARSLGVHDSKLGRALFGALAAQPTFWDSKQREGLFDALREMEKLGLISERHSYWQVTASGHEIVDDMTGL